MAKKIKVTKMGKLRIYITPADKLPPKGKGLLKKMFPKSAFIHIVQEAKKDGILNASVYHTSHGYSNKNKIESMNYESGNPKLTLCVELVDARKHLEAFCLKHEDLLRDKVVIYKEVEQWSLA
ncbi:MAG: hypothetical protein LDLANPLL_01833 [Turneriella sp.]|nr:hypothetical protein [Turneriella sp.]